MVLTATVDPACQELRGVLKTRKPRRRVPLRVNASVPCTKSVAFDSTFEGIQKVIFERHGCTAGRATAARRPGRARPLARRRLRNLFEVPSTASTLHRVEPGDQRPQLPLAQARRRDRPVPAAAGRQIAGAPMPNGLAAAQRGRARAGAALDLQRRAETGTVAGTEAAARRLPAAARADHIEPLEPPAPARASSS